MGVGDIEQLVKKVSDKPVNGIWLVGFAHAASVFRAMINGDPYPVKALLTIGKNPLLTYPNARQTYEALMRLDLHVAKDVFMTPTCRVADYVLPAACSFEKPFLYGVEIFPFLHGGEAAIDPLYERKPEFYLWRELGIRLGQENYWPWKTLEEAYDWRLEPLGMTFKEFMAGTAHDSPPLPMKKYEANGFGTPTGKYELYCTTLKELGYDPLPSYKEPDTFATDMASDFQSGLRVNESMARLPNSAAHLARFLGRRHFLGRDVSCVPHLQRTAPRPISLVRAGCPTRLGLCI